MGHLMIHMAYVILDFRLTEFPQLCLILYIFVAISMASLILDPVCQFFLLHLSLLSLFLQQFFFSFYPRHFRQPRQNQESISGPF